jgi:Uri superfamily endonuclease
MAATDGQFGLRSGPIDEEELPISGAPDGERGTYILLVSLEQDMLIGVGRLGPIHFSAGTYAYCGSAMAGYRGRVGRHFSSSKKLRWHIDYLLEGAEPVAALLAPGGEGMECALGRMLSDMDGSEPIKGFGSSDCRCGSHLYRIEESSIPFLTEKIKAFSSPEGLPPEND